LNDRGGTQFDEFSPERPRAWLKFPGISD